MKQKAFVINLDKRKDRLKKFNEEIKEISFLLDIKRIKAIDGSKVNLKKKYKKINPWNFQNLANKVLRGQVACALSHLKAWKKISKIKQPFALVFEDDVVLLNNKKLNNLLKQLNKLSFDIVFLNEEYPSSKKNKIIKKIKGFILNKEFMPVKKNSTWQTTEAYAITPNGAEKFYHKIKNNLGAIDAHIRQVISEDIKIRAFSLFSPIFSQNHKDSDIQENKINIDDKKNNF